MTPKRHNASTITDDALDALYDNANRGWRRGDIWKAKAQEIEADRDQLDNALSDVLRIVSDWAIEANDYGGVDATDLVFRLEQAGHKLPEENTSK